MQTGAKYGMIVMNNYLVNLCEKGIISVDIALRRSDNPDYIRCYQCGNQGGVGNSTFADIDGDGDYDYFSGSGVNGTQLHFAENTGSPDSAFFITNTLHYQNLDFGIPFNFDMGDVDLDGDYDMIVCKRGGNVAYY
jgi:hypothetical protein